MILRILAQIICGALCDTPGFLLIGHSIAVCLGGTVGVIVALLVVGVVRVLARLFALSAKVSLASAAKATLVIVGPAYETDLIIGRRSRMSEGCRDNQHEHENTDSLLHGSLLFLQVKCPPEPLF
jgi:hypothetical protein